MNQFWAILIVDIELIRCKNKPTLLNLFSCVIQKQKKLYSVSCANKVASKPMCVYCGFTPARTILINGLNYFALGSSNSKGAR